MAASKSYFIKPNYLGEMTAFVGSDSMFELDESDVWNVSVEVRKTAPSSRMSKRSPAMAVKRGEVGGTATVSGPDGSKIRRRYGDDDGVEDRIPPHEFLARRRMASCSVQEGIGRTLKGRDLSRLRNAVWEVTGFED